jgi:hypothetical protein
MPGSMIKKLVGVSVALFICLGCTPPVLFESRINSLSQADALTKLRYVLLPGNKDVSADDLQFREYASYLEIALAERGFKKAVDIKDADIAIFLAYGIGDPKTNYYSYSMPTWGQTGVSGSYTTGNVNVYGNTAIYSQNTTYTPTYGITGYTSNLASHTTFTRYIFIDAIDNMAFKQDQKMLPVWKTSVFSTGSSGDLRRVFPVMVAAMKPYLGANTRQSITINLDENDPAVQKLKGITTK